MKRRQIRGTFWVSLTCTALSCSGQALASAPAGTEPDNESVIVTGTRETHKKVRDSLSPVDVVSNREMLNTGQTNATAALAQLLPSVTRPAVGQFDGAPTDFISLRGLNPRLRTHSQNKTVAARQTAEKKTVGHLS